jgi:hypothetical protein
MASCVFMLVYLDVWMSNLLNESDWLVIVVFYRFVRWEKLWDFMMPMVSSVVLAIRGNRDARYLRWELNVKISVPFWILNTGGQINILGSCQSLPEHHIAIGRKSRLQPIVTASTIPLTHPSSQNTAIIHHRRLPEIKIQIPNVKITPR